MGVLPEPPRSDAKLTLGWMYWFVENGGTLSPDDQETLDWHKANQPFALYCHAARSYNEWWPTEARKQGMAVTTTTRRVRNGRVTWHRKVRGPIGRGRPPRPRTVAFLRPRERRDGSSSRTSGTSPPSDDADPVEGAIGGAR